MADNYFQTLGRVFHPTAVKVAATVVVLVGVYDTFSNQFNLPKLGRLLGMSGSLLPWWGWLLILQSIFVIALFEYVRRNVEPKRQVDNQDAEDEPEEGDAEVVTPGYVENVLSAHENKYKSTFQAFLNNINVFAKRIDEIERRTALPPQHGRYSPGSHGVRRTSAPSADSPYSRRS